MNVDDIIEFDRLHRVLNLENFTPAVFVWLAGESTAPLVMSCRSRRVGPGVAVVLFD